MKVKIIGGKGLKVNKSPGSRAGMEMGMGLQDCTCW